MATKGTLPYHINASPLWKYMNVGPVLVVLASGLIGKILLSIVLMDWKPIHIWLHVWPHMSLCCEFWETKCVFRAYYWKY